MPAGDAGLERPTLRSWPEVEPELRRRTTAGLQPRLCEVRALLAQLAAQQAVVDAAREIVRCWDLGGVSLVNHRSIDEVRIALVALAALAAAQAAQPEGEPR